MKSPFKFDGKLAWVRGNIKGVLICRQGQVE